MERRPPYVRKDGYENGTGSGIGYENKNAKTERHPFRAVETSPKGVVTDRLACRWICESGVMTVEQLWRAVGWSPESNSATLHQ